MGTPSSLEGRGNPIASSAAVAEPLTILVVDDERTVLSSITKMLRTIGHRPLLANSGQEALEICLRSGGKIDLLLTDIQMPEMSGIELAHCLTKIHSTISVLFMSNRQTETPQMRLLLREGNFRVNEILRKPFSSKMLAKAIKNVMQQQRKQLAPYEIVKTS